MNNDNYKTIQNEHSLIDHRLQADLYLYNNKKHMDLDFERERMKLREEKSLRTAMSFVEISESDTDIFYGFRNSDLDELKVSRISPQGKLRLKIYESFYPTNKRIYAFSFNGGTTFFEQDGNCSAKNVFQSLANKGYRLACRKRIWLEVVEAFWSHLLEKAVSEEIPGTFGWNRMHDGKWQYANEDDLTMEVLKDEV